jgi:hypothetical protein
VTTTSTAPVVLDALLESLGDALSPVRVFESWPGPEAAAEMLFFAETEWDVYEIATIKAGRKARQEDYSIKFSLWKVGDDGTSPASPRASRERCYELFGLVEDVLAEDVTAGAGSESVQWITVEPDEAKPVKFEKGWAYALDGRFRVHARLL